MDQYDEFGMLQDNASEAGLPWDGPPAVRRSGIDAGGGRQVSALLWGDAPPELAFLHGGAQNAHTWDTVALALKRPLIAIDMPGHGHSDWRVEGEYPVTGMAFDVGMVIEELAPTATTLVGMGLGSPVALLAADGLDQITRLVMIDSASGARPPASGARQQSAAGANVMEFTGGPHEFDTFDEILERTVRYNAGRSEQSLRRGILHNAKQLPDGRWSWRWDPRNRNERDFAFAALEEALDRFTGPILLVRGAKSDIVTDEAVAAFTARHRDTTLVTIEGAGHGVQGDRPVELAQTLANWLQ